MGPTRSLKLSQQPGKPKPPGNPPRRRAPDEVPPIEEEPMPIPLPPMENDPPPMRV